MPIIKYGIVTKEMKLEFEGKAPIIRGKKESVDSKTNPHSLK